MGVSEEDFQRYLSNTMSAFNKIKDEEKDKD